MESRQALIAPPGKSIVLPILAGYSVGLLPKRYIAQLSFLLPGFNSIGGRTFYQYFLPFAVIWSIPGCCRPFPSMSPLFRCFRLRPRVSEHVLFRPFANTKSVTFLTFQLFNFFTFCSFSHFSMFFWPSGSQLPTSNCTPFVARKMYQFWYCTQVLRYVRGPRTLGDPRYVQNGAIHVPGHVSHSDT